MKNMVKLFGIIAIVAVIGFGLVGCGAKDVSLVIRNATSVTLEIGAGLEEVSWNGTLAAGESKTIVAEAEALEASYTVHYGTPESGYKDKIGKFNRNDGSKTVTITNDDL